MEVELFKINYERTSDMPPAQSSSGLITFINQPAGYIAFQSSNLSYLLKMVQITRQTIMAFMLIGLRL